MGCVCACVLPAVLSGRYVLVRAARSVFSCLSLACTYKRVVLVHVWRTCVLLGRDVLVRARCVCRC